MSGHTKEPWRVKHAEHGSNCFYVVDSDATSAVARVTNYKMQGVGEANARRIVACVNACEGIPTEDLERYYGAGGGIDAAMQEAALSAHLMAIKQRDRLLSVLAMFAELDDCCDQRDQLAAFDEKHGVGGKGRYTFLYDAVREAIAAVETSK